MTRATDKAVGGVLVVEEEAPIRRLIEMALAQTGIPVDCVADPESATEKCKKAVSSGQPFGLVILDLNMAGKTVAVDLLEQLKRIDPGIKAVVTSGDVFNDVMTNHSRFGFQGALAKPFSLRELTSMAYFMIKNDLTGPEKG